MLVLLVWVIFVFVLLWLFLFLFFSQRINKLLTADSVSLMLIGLLRSIVKADYAKVCRDLYISETQWNSTRQYFYHGASRPLANIALGLCLYFDSFNATLLAFARHFKHFVTIYRHISWNIPEHISSSYQHSLAGFLFTTLIKINIPIC